MCVRVQSRGTMDDTIVAALAERRGRRVALLCVREDGLLLVPEPGLPTRSHPSRELTRQV